MEAIEVSDKQLAHLKNILQRRLKETEELLDQDIDWETQELSTVDNHPADNATELMMQTTELAIEELREEEAEEIQAALQAIEEGTYGKCEVCGKEIEFERLEALPTATTCLEHAE